MKDPSNIPDPYVKLYLLPGRSKESKRRTVVVKQYKYTHENPLEGLIPGKIFGYTLIITGTTCKYSEVRIYIKPLNPRIYFNSYLILGFILIFINKISLIR